MTNGLEVNLRGSATDYQRIEDDLLKLADRGSSVGGSLSIELTPPVPITLGDDLWEQFRLVVVNNDPGIVTLLATITKNN